MQNPNIDHLLTDKMILLISDRWILLEEPGNWTSARQACIDMGYELLSIHSEAENEYLNMWLQGRLDTSEFNKVWLGARLGETPVRELLSSSVW